MPLVKMLYINLLQVLFGMGISPNGKDSRKIGIFDRRCQDGSTVNEVRAGMFTAKVP
jgi:hypothetical protein